MEICIRTCISVHHFLPYTSFSIAILFLTMEGGWCFSRRKLILGVWKLKLTTPTLVFFFHFSTSWGKGEYGALGVVKVVLILELTLALAILEGIEAFIWHYDKLKKEMKQ